VFIAPALYAVTWGATIRDGQLLCGPPGFRHLVIDIGATGGFVSQERRHPRGVTSVVVAETAVVLSRRTGNPIDVVEELELG
jgi:hypothetical protein